MEAEEEEEKEKGRKLIKLVINNFCGLEKSQRNKKEARNKVI